MDKSKLTFEVTGVGGDDKGSLIIQTTGVDIVISTSWFWHLISAYHRANRASFEDKRNPDQVHLVSATGCVCDHEAFDFDTHAITTNFYEVTCKDCRKKVRGAIRAWEDEDD